MIANKIRFSAILMIIGIQAASAAYIFSPIAPCPTCTAQAGGINNAGQVAGIAYDVDGNAHGFIRNNGQYSLFDPANSVFTEATHINGLGQIAGDYVNAADGI